MLNFFKKGAKIKDLGFQISDFRFTFGELRFAPVQIALPKYIGSGPARLTYALFLLKLSFIGQAGCRLQENGVK